MTSQQVRGAEVVIYITRLKPAHQRQRLIAVRCLSESHLCLIVTVPAFCRDVVKCSVQAGSVRIKHLNEIVTARHIAHDLKPIRSGGQNNIPWKLYRTIEGQLCGLIQLASLRAGRTRLR